MVTNEFFDLMVYVEYQRFDKHPEQIQLFQNMFEFI